MNLERVEALAQAVELADGRLDPDWVEHARSVVNRARQRITHGTDATVVALAGATGSGKSTLFNALSGSLVSQAGVRRPTTGAVHASVWGEEDETRGLLDWLEASKRHFLTRPDSDLDGLVLLDLPDFDSTTRENRMVVDRLVELVDALIWVTDPQKYGDELLHTNYIQPLSRYGDVMVFLLNQIDLLDEKAQAACKADLEHLLQIDGINDPEVLGVSATVGTGLDQLRALLSDVVRKRKAVLSRIDADLRTVTAEVDVDVDPAKRIVSKSTRSTLVAALGSAAGVDQVTKAVARSYKLDAAGVMGWPATRWLRKLRANPLRRFRLGTEGRSSLPGPSAVEDAQARMAVRATVEEATAAWGEPWTSLARRAVEEQTPAMVRSLDEAVSRSVTRFDRPRWWGLIGSLQWLVFLVMVAGIIWLVALFALDAFQVPNELITPEWNGWPIPTLAAIGGAIAGLLLAWVGRLVAAMGARRRARLATREVHEQVAAVADTYVLGPIEQELQVGVDLGRLLRTAAGSRRT